MDVENAGNDVRCAGLHADCRKLDFGKVERGWREEARDSDRGIARAKDRMSSILKSRQPTEEE
jgi:hypothetical protein